MGGQFTCFVENGNIVSDSLGGYYNSIPLSYDDIGNLTNFDVRTFSWTAGQQLAGFELNTEDYAVTYKYNADGLRTQKYIDDDQTYTQTTYDYIWADGKLVSQTDGTDVLYFLYDSSDSPIGFVLNDSATYLYIKNLQGDITGIADENGAIIVNYTYNEWGKLLSTTGSEADTIGLLNPLRYRGYYYDTETGYYYLQSRYYNPSWGRFINADDVEVLFAAQGDLFSTNLSAYCCNDAINSNDPTGYWKKGIHYGAKFYDNKSKGLPGTYEWARFLGYIEVDASSIAYYDANTDEWSNGTSPIDLRFDAQKYHFNMYPTGVKDTRSEISQSFFVEALRQYYFCNWNSSFKYLGEGLHALQDIEAHGNWGRNFIVKGAMPRPHGDYHDNVEYDWQSSERVYLNKTKNPAIGGFWGIGGIRIGERYRETEKKSKEYLYAFLKLKVG